MRTALWEKGIKNLILPTEENNFRPFILRDEVIAIFILLFLVGKVLFSFELVLVQQSSLFAELNAQKILLLTNDIRKQYHLPSLKENALLDKAAWEKAQDMLKHKYFSHYSPTGVSPWYWIDASGYNYHYAGENLAMNFLNSEEVVRAWLNSPKHRENLLNKHYEDMGLAIVNGDFTGEGINRTLVVQMFASPMREKTIAPIAKAASSPPTSLPPTPTSPLPVPSTTTPTTLVTTTTTTTTTTTITTTTLVTTTTEQPLPLLSQKGNNISSFKASVLSNIALKDYHQVDIANKIIAGLLIFLGGIVIIGIVWQQRKVSFASSELLMRSIIIIILGIAFITVNFPSLMGKLLIA